MVALSKINFSAAKSIRRQLAVGFSILSLLMLLIISNGLYRLHHINLLLDEIVHNHNYKLQLANTMHEALLVRRSSLYMYAGLDDEFERAIEWEKFNEAASTYLISRGKLISLELIEEERSIIKQLDLLTATGQKLQLLVISLVDQGALAEARRLLFEEARPQQQKVIEQVSELVAMQNRLNTAASNKAQTTYRSIFISTIVLSMIVAIAGLVASMAVTRRVSQQARETEVQRRKFQTLFNSSLDAVMIWDNWKLIQCNEAARSTFNLHNPQDKSISLSDLLLPVQADGMDVTSVLDSLYQDMRQERQHLFEYEMVGTDGHNFPAEIRVSPVLIDDRSLIQTVIRDISSRKKAEKQLAWLAYYDQLTGLPNEALFTDRLQTAIEQFSKHGQEIGLLTINLDRFNHINESLGWAAGNELLVKISERLTTLKQESDTLARMSADEFMLLLPGVEHVSELLSIAESLLNKIAEPVELLEQDIHVSCRIGIARYPSDGVTASELMKNSRSAARLAAAHESEGISLYDESMNASAYRQIHLANTLLPSLKRGDFYLVYQPKYAVHDNKIMGVEALVRWKHPTYGEILPSEFIPVAEFSKGIEQLGEWVLREAIDLARRISMNYRDRLEMAINLSMTQCSSPGFVDMIKDLLHPSGEKLDIALEFEVTESLALDSNAKIISRLNDLRELGIRIAIDDFGTGYSSLSHLRELPVDTLKIDKSFICDLESNTEHQEIVAMIIMLGHKLGFDVVAEGIESAEQLSYLQIQDCDTAQGFYLSIPIREEALLELLEIPVTNGNDNIVSN